MGYALRRIRLLCWGGKFAVEGVAMLPWNRRQVCYGIGGNFRTEYALRAAGEEGRYNDQNRRVPASLVCRPLSPRDTLLDFLWGDDTRRLRGDGLHECGSGRNRRDDMP